MKTKNNRLSIALGLLALSTLNPHLSTIFAQGALTPPGAPAPTMKSLDQIEARTPISSLPYTITNPGSYYVTANLTGISGSDGIDIATNNVALDLNGFTLQGVAGSLNGIYVPNLARNLSIRNGVVDSWGQSGVNANDGYNSQFERLCISSNSVGLTAGANCILLFDTVYQSKGSGIGVGNSSIIKDCTANGNGGYGIAGNGNNFIVKDCTANANGLDGFFVTFNSTVKDCTANANSTDGMYVQGSGNQISGNTCSGNNSYGIYFFSGQNRVDNNNVGNNGNYGIYANSLNVGNTITRNFSPGPGYGNYPGNSDYAPIQTPTNNPASPWANF